MLKRKQKILIIGGGFGGAKAALALSHVPTYDVTLMSDRPDFRYYPSLYRAATGGKLAASVVPLSEIFESQNVRVIKDEAISLDRSRKVIKGASGASYNYDTLVLALGVMTNFFGIKGLDKYSYGIKSPEEAMRLRDHIHEQLVSGQPELNYVVVGGGPTGVELAGSLPSYIKHVIKRHKLPSQNPHIDLVEAAPRLMPRMPKRYSSRIAKRLRKLGVHLYLGQTVQAETAEQLQLSGHSIASHTVAWTAGVINHPFFAANEFNMGSHGKVAVNEFLQAEPDIYVIGDNADTPYSGMAQTALYDASFIARNLRRQAAGKAARPYRPKRPIYVTPVGPRWAAVAWGKVTFFGWLGKLVRSFADLSGYHEVEPWRRAAKHWMAEDQTENSCELCG